MARRNGSAPAGSAQEARVMETVETPAPVEAPAPATPAAAPAFTVRTRTASARPANAGRKAWDLEGLLDAVKALGAEEEVYLEVKASIVRAWCKRHFGANGPFRTVKDATGNGVSIVRKRNA